MWVAAGRLCSSSHSTTTVTTGGGAAVGTKRNRLLLVGDARWHTTAGDNVLVFWKYHRSGGCVMCRRPHCRRPTDTIRKCPTALYPLDYGFRTAVGKEINGRRGGEGVLMFHVSC